MVLLLLLASLRPAPFTKLELGALHAINAARQAHGLPPLHWNPKLAAAARDHSYRMVEAGFFAHTDPAYGDLRARLKRFRMVTWVAAAENIFDEQGYPDPVRAAVSGLLDSPPHRANILDPRFTETGVGVALRPGGTYFFTQVFLRPR